jgi:hypothetical protein
VIAVIHDGHTEINPGPETTIDVDDVLVLLGTTDQIHHAIEQHLAAADAGKRSSQCTLESTIDKQYVHFLMIPPTTPASNTTGVLVSPK